MFISAYSENTTKWLIHLNDGRDGYKKVNRLFRDLSATVGSGSNANRIG